MTESKSFSLAARLRSFGHAFAGLWFLLRTQHNAWIHLAATLAVIAAGVALHIPVRDWRWLTLAIVLVWFAEGVNTALEQLCDLVSPDYNETIKRAKDVAAGAVLISAIGAAFIGATVFAPYFLR